VRAENLSISYGSGKTRVDVVQDLTFEVAAGEFFAITGVSGSGKSSILHAIGGLVDPIQGDIWVGDVRVDQLDRADRSILRRDTVSYVFQAFHLFPSLSALDNASFVARLQNAPDASERARNALLRVGLEARLAHRPPLLSGGEQQRVAVARALASRPRVILADEPTGNLDTAASALVRDLLDALRRETGCTVIVASHDPEMARLAERHLDLGGTPALVTDNQVS
jgi:putative ABC transport system ATP-binding protein